MKGTTDQHSCLHLQNFLRFAQRQQHAPAGEVVRLYCGLEDAADLQADLAQALRVLA